MSFLEFRNSKLLSPETLQPWLARQALHNRRVGFTNGVFDLLHKGHVDYLCAARDACDVLLIGVNSDQSVRQLNKGPERPLNSELDRALVLCGLSAVDAVLIFDAETPAELIELVKPSVLIKGGDYDPNCTNPGDKRYIVGSRETRARGGQVLAIPLTEGRSTTRLVNLMKGDGQA